MFAKILEFCANHWQLVGAFIGAVGALFVYEHRKQGKVVTPSALVRAMNQEGAVVVDVRDSKEFTKGHITNARNIPYAELKDRAIELKSHEQHPVVLVCGVGQYSGAAAKLLQQVGFQRVLRLSGGIQSWTAQGLPLVSGKA